MAERLSDLADALWPHLARRVAQATGGAAALNVASPTDHGALTGLLDDDHPQYLTAGRGDGRYPALADWTTHIGNADAHHARLHVLATNAGLGADHTISGAAAGQVLRASSATAAAFAQLAHSDLSGIGTNTHTQIDTHIGTADIHVAHSGVSIVAGDGLTGGGTIAVSRTLNVAVANTIQSGAGGGLSVNADAVRLTASHNPGAAAAVLASDATGKLTLPLLVASSSVTTPLVTAGAGQSLTLQAPLDLILSPTSDLVRMGSGASLQASSYASQTTGWRVTDAGEADFRYMFVDEMHAKSFIADLEQALAGGQIIAKSVAMVATAFTLPAAGATGTLRVKDLPSAPNMAVFQSGDFVGLRLFSRAGGSLTIGWAWGTVTAYADGTGGNEGTQTWTFTRHATTPGAATGVIPADALALDFGVSGNGFYEVNAIDGAYGQNSPYAQIVTWATHPATQTVRARLGNLRGIFSVANEFGLYAGSGTAVTDRYIRASSAALELRNVPLALYDGSDNTLLLSAGTNNNSPFLAMGSPLPTGPLVNDGIWAGKDGSVYELRVGTVSGGALVKGLHWNGANLVWKATNTSLDASGNLTATNATLSGQVTATTGAIGGWTIAASGLTATNIGLYSGAANTARVQVGSGSDIAGINATAAAGDIAFWAGDTHANRAAAEFRVTAAGALSATGATISGAITATSGTIAGDFSVTSGGKLTASGGGIVLTHTGINIGVYANLAQTVAPPDTSKALTWYADPSNPGAVMARQYVSESSPGNPYWSIAVDPAGSGPRITLWDSNEKYLWFDNITNVVGLPGVTWFVGGIAPITAHFDVDPNTAFWLESGSEFRAWTHLLPGEDFPTTAYNIGSASKRWGAIYANNMVISGAISGATLSGAEWEYAGSMIIDANAASNTTVSIVNQNASYTASLDVEGNITVGGTVDSVDLAGFKSAYDSHAHSWSSITSKPSTFAPSAHALVGADHTASGLTAGHVVRASGTATFAWAQLAHSDLSGAGTNTHANIDSHIAAAAAHGVSGAIVGTTDTQTLSNKTLTTPTIASFVNATHAHTDTASGGQIAHTSLTSIGTNTHAQIDTHIAGSDIHVAHSTVTMTAGDGLTGGGTIAASRTITLGTPSTLTVATTNAVTTTSHTHAITSSSNPGAAASILASNASGYLQLTRLGVGAAPVAAIGLAASTTAVGGIDFGGDVNLYRSAANVLKTDDLFNAAGGLQKNGIEAIAYDDLVEFAEPWQPKRIVMPELFNLLHRADARFTVTQTGFATFSANTLFYNLANTSNKINAGGTGVVTIDFTAKGEYGVSGITYPGGYIYIHCYKSGSPYNQPQTVSGRFLDKDGVWRNLTSPTWIAPNIWRLTHPGNIYTVTMELSIVALPDDSTFIWSIEYYPFRPTGLFMTFPNKFQAERIYSDWTWRNSSNVATATIAASGAITGTSLTSSGLTASRLVSAGSGGLLQSVSNLASWIAGTANRITVADDGDGTVTLSAPQDIHTGASPTFGGLIAPWLRPASDSTTALQLRNASNTAVLTVDTIYNRIGIGVTPTATLHVSGDIRATGTIYADGGNVDFGTNYLQESTDFELRGTKAFSLFQTIKASGWNITTAGAATLTDVITPSVRATTGTALTIGAGTDIILDPTSDLVRMGSGASLQASSYASQTTGWRVTDAGEADFRYMFVDEMHAKSFIADLEQALAGGQIIAKSVAVVATDFTLPTAGNNGTLRVRDLPSAPNMAVFQSGDFIGLRLFSRAAGSLTIGWAWGTVTGYVDGTGGNEGTQTWTFSRNPGTPGAATGTIPADALALDFGVSGNGFYEVNAIDGAYGANSPYAQVVTWATHPATQTVRARMGNLRGIFSVADEFGLYAGSGTAVTDRYIRASSSALELRNIPLALFDGSNNTLLLSAGASNNSPFLAIGSPLPTGPLVNDGIWAGKDGSVYELRVGTVSGGALVKGLHWDGANLVWKATNTSLDASGNLQASNATLSGQITATTGAIGGWTLGATSLTAGSAGTTVGLDSGGTNPAIYAGSATPGSAPFRVTNAGVLTATSGTVGGWTLSASALTGGSATLSNTGKLTLGTSNNVLIADAADGTYRLYIGNADPAQAPFSVTRTGGLTSTLGLIGGWAISSNSIIGGGSGEAKLLSTGKLTLGTIMGMAVVDSTHADWRLWIGSGSDISTDPLASQFRVSRQGHLSAFGATIVGAITANAGYIGGDSGWTIATGAITSNNIGLYSGEANTVARIEVGTGATLAGINSASNAAHVAFWAGSAYADRETAAFNVTAGGALTASNATVTGTITANAGYIGGTSGWTISTGEITSVSSGATAMRLSALGASPFMALGATAAPGLWMGDGLWMGQEEATTNLVTNPSFETNTTSWSVYTSGSPTGTRTRVTTHALAGQYSYELVKTGGGTTDRWGIYRGRSVVSGETYTFSAWVKVTAITGGDERIWMQASTNVVTATANITGVGDWRRLTVTTTATATGTAKFYIWIHSATTATIYVDAVQLENKAYATPYIDGSMATGTWSGTAHASASSRTAATRARMGAVANNALTAGWSWDGAALNVVGSITATSGSIAGALTMGESGGIYQGTGTFASPTTGLKIWNESDIGRIAGYNAGTAQWYAGTDGKLYAGGGNVTLDNSGIRVEAASSTWDTTRSFGITRSGTVTSGLFGLAMSSGATHVALTSNTTVISGTPNVVDANRDALLGIVTAASGSSYNSAIQLYAAHSGVVAGASQINIVTRPSASYVEVYSAEILLDSGIVRVTGGLSVGDDVGGAASTLTLTNATGAAGGAGTGTVKMNDGTNRNNNGFIKMYVGTTAVFVPYWTTIAG
jgi:lipoprotein signal peptidase